MVYIALGSNIGDSVAVVREAMDRLEQISSEPLVRSSLWKTTPVECPEGSASFVNAAVGLNPRESETPESLLQELQEMERESGRRPKTVLNEARPLDLDIVAWEQEVRNSPSLVLPHPRAHLRRFVLAPLAEIAPELILPGQKKTVRELLAELRTDEIIEKLS